MYTTGSDVTYKFDDADYLDAATIKRKLLKMRNNDRNGNALVLI